MNSSFTYRRARKLRVEFTWALEDYAEVDKEFEKILSTQDISLVVIPIEDKFFYRLAFIGPEGFDNEEMSKKVYNYLLPLLSDLDDFAGIAVNFIS